MTVTFNPNKLGTLFAELGDPILLGNLQERIMLEDCRRADERAADRARVASVNSPLAGQVYGAAI